MAVLTPAKAKAVGLSQWESFVIPHGSDVQAKVWEAVEPLMKRIFVAGFTRGAEYALKAAVASGIVEPEPEADGDGKDA